MIYEPILFEKIRRHAGHKVVVFDHGSVACVYCTECDKNILHVENPNSELDYLANAIPVFSEGEPVVHKEGF